MMSLTLFTPFLDVAKSRAARLSISVSDAQSLRPLSPGARAAKPRHSPDVFCFVGNAHRAFPTKQNTSGECRGREQAIVMEVRQALCDRVICLEDDHVGCTVSRPTFHVKRKRDTRPAQPRYSMLQPRLPARSEPGSLARAPGRLASIRARSRRALLASACTACVESTRLPDAARPGPR